MPAPPSFARRSRWPVTLVSLGLLVLPLVLTPLWVALAILATLCWQGVHGARPVAPDAGTLTLMALGGYAVAVWISIGLAWRWSARLGHPGEVFAFRRPTVLDVTIVLVGFLAAWYAAPVIHHWAQSLVGVRPGRGSFAPPAWTTALVVISTIVTAPLGEEVLFRGLLVFWLRRLGWPSIVIWLVGSLVFAAIHLPTAGPAWSITIFCFGGMLLAIRLWRGSLTPCWLIHLLFNLRTIPTIAVLLVGLLPG